MTVKCFTRAWVVFGLFAAVTMQVIMDATAVDSPTDTVNLNIDQLKSLFEDITTGYDVRIRPRRVQSDVVSVNVTFTPYSIISLHTTKQRLDILGYFNIFWKDELLSWKPDNYFGTNTIKLPASTVWKPKLVILQTYGSGFIGNSKVDIVKISYDGMIQWVPDAIYRVVCEIDVELYPFDMQKCQLQFQVADETNETVIVQTPSVVPMDDYVENSEWILESATSSTTSHRSKDLINVNFNIRRRPQFTLLTTIFPLLNLVTVNVFGTLMPIESGEKGTFMVTFFLAFTFVVTSTSDTLPKTSTRMSYAVMYLCMCIVVSIVTVVYVILQAKLFTSFNDTNFKIPAWLKCRRQEKLEHDGSVQESVENLNVRDRNNQRALFFRKMDLISFSLLYLCVLTYSCVTLVLII